MNRFFAMLTALVLGVVASLPASALDFISSTDGSVNTDVVKTALTAPDRAGDEPGLGPGYHHPGRVLGVGPGPAFHRRQALNPRACGRFRFGRVLLGKKRPKY